ncbi:MAG: acyl-CoA dehydrogenase [Actinobacteria bacterium]|nr:MAG: acyl-CoA dehydrogenase [Actinomycetota bacterium]
MDVVETARTIAEEVLFPAAIETDRADVLPAWLLDELAHAGLYGLGGPQDAGGIDADFPAVCCVIETLASGCLTTTFVWIQHLGAIRAAASSENHAIAGWVEPLCSGRRRAGLAIGGAVPGPPLLVARESSDGWLLTGTSPFLSGWGRIDVVHTAARTEDGRLLWVFLDAAEGASFAVERLELVALNATATVRAEFRDHAVPAERVTSISPYEEGPPPPELLRVHAAMPLGVTARCLALLGPSPLDEELADLRGELDRLDPQTMQAARGAAGELALRSAAALAVSTGSRSILLRDHAQRLVREALFALVYALRPGSRQATLERLSGSSSNGRAGA